MSVLESFDRWKQFLSERVEQAEKSGMDSDIMSNAAYHIGDYLAEQVDPKNGEERLLKELWDAGDEDEQRVLANLMVKYVSHDR
ncbi:DUF3243 domain-containing protein [Rubeoparvulum massiliense]|uniref:DUF3243 domain-containing protein n=1 Tax=Rubeoparvulum massiliense TaxID=1631346 RepID=UPI00065E7825|nr:DUF3243 domain-containing protein [Rubeoparvulum massiliense]